MKDMTLRPEGSDSEFIGVIVLKRPFYTVFYATPSEGLPRLVKHQYLLNENVLNKKLEHFYNILKKECRYEDLYLYIILHVCNVFLVFGFFVKKFVYIC